MKINIGFLLSYDYELLKHAVPLVYDEADKIILAVDENYITWSGNKFEIDESFYDWLSNFDRDNKIEVYRDNFYIPENTSMENEVRERNMIAEQLGEGICIQLDADEYVLDFKGMVSFLKKHKNKLSSKKIQICPYLIDIYKKSEEGFFLIEETTPFYMGTTHPHYVRGRKNYKQQKWYIPFVVVHQTWGRSEEELKFKLENWGHNTDFDVEEFFKFWRLIDKNNYQDFSNFHPLDKNAWKKLIYIPETDIQNIINNPIVSTIIPKSKYLMKNLGQEFKFLFK